MITTGIVMRSYGASPRLVEGVLYQHASDVRLADGRVFMPATPKRLAPGVRVQLRIDHECTFLGVLA